MNAVCHFLHRGAEALRHGANRQHAALSLCASVPLCELAKWRCIRLLLTIALSIAFAESASAQTANKRLTPQLLGALEGMTQPPGAKGPPPSIDGPEDLPEPSPRLEEMVERAAEPQLELTAPQGAIVVDEPFAYYADEALLFQPPKLKPYRNGFFQKLSLSGTWLYPGTEDADIGFTDIETFGMFALPFPIVEWPLVLTPGYNLHMLSGPEITDLPPRLHDAYIDFMWLPTFVHRWTALVSLTPGYYSDFEFSDSDAFRLTGKGLVIFDAHPQKLQLVAGVLYLGRDNLKLLPAGGAIWRPTDDFAFELIFPRPKLAARLNYGQGYENWLYTTAEYGGNTYVVERASGARDKLTYQDFRLLVGYEHRRNYGAGFRLEAGYVFGRQVDFASATGDFEPGDTLLLRAGVTF